ncbi:trypsin-like serine peptidase [Granulicoccus phenolivorans]|uniref:trypsin-like serine peptidase n=1 Tax=Granulicoccus phenolivorans TaxID=266854 RepID=UPI000425D4AC|nr:trypsin-like serine protease [Granulicoccus phenolivorans]
MTENTNPHEPVQPEADAEDTTVDQLSDAPETGAGGTAATAGDVEAAAATLYEMAAAEDTAPDTSALRPIGEATYGASAETVFLPDNRIQINNTADYPWRANASLLITANDNSKWLGTGWFIGPKTMVTAGHCVFIQAPGTTRHGWVKSIEVMPGRNGNTLPYGKVVVPRSNLRSVTGWTNSANQEYDYGAMILPTNLGSTTGWYGFAAWSDATLNGRTLNISGYPGDKPSGTQWYHWSGIAALGARKIYYTIDTAGGQSGSAVYVIDNGSRYGVAIHAYGGSTSNSGTRITSGVFTNLQNWKN